MRRISIGPTHAFAGDLYVSSSSSITPRIDSLFLPKNKYMAPISGNAGGPGIFDAISYNFLRPNSIFRYNRIKAITQFINQNAEFIVFLVLLVFLNFVCLIFLI